jgi:hypothetical protein
VILYVVLDCDGYYQVLQIMTKDYYRRFLGRDGYCHFSKIIIRAFFIMSLAVMGIVLYM